ncbi:MAG: flagellar motor protein MotB, partial [Alphaproteobacteria bacterium HGW-Alphaproteobacteria-8]
MALSDAAGAAAAREIAQLRALLNASEAARAAREVELGGASSEAERLAALLAAAQSARAQAVGRLNTQLSEADRQAVLLALANQTLAAEKAVSAENARKVALLNQQVAELRGQLSELQAILIASAERDASNKVQVETLGSQLNAALAQVADEQRRRADLEAAERARLEAETQRLAAEAKQLSRYRSEFFGRLSELLAGREGVRVVGDRFVFSSEVLF